VGLSRAGLDWVAFATRATEAIGRVLGFSRTCWHTVDPGTVLFTGSVNQNVSCSGSWLAEHEYVLDDVNKWQFLARSGRAAGATGLATHGDLRRSARHRSHAEFGIGDELRGSFVADGTYWGAVGFLRERDDPWFTEDDVRFLAALCRPLADGFRRALLRATGPSASTAPHGPGVVVFDESGRVESLSPAAEHWIAEMVEIPAPSEPAESKVLQVVAARARTATSSDPLLQSARSRVQTRTGEWLLLYGTRLSGAGGRTAVILQPATRHEVAPLIALAYGLSERECRVAQLCIAGRSTREMAQAMQVSPYTVQDHLKSIFAKTGVRSRGELVGQVFLEQYAPRWDDAGPAEFGWSVWHTPGTLEA
jgi:DNA-binding CsgD family transcriptional regulator